MMLIEGSYGDAKYKSAANFTRGRASESRIICLRKDASPAMSVDCGRDVARTTGDPHSTAAAFRAGTSSLYLNGQLIEFPAFEPVEAALGQYCLDAFRQTSTPFAEKKGRYMANCILSAGILDAVRHALRTAIPVRADASLDHCQTGTEVRSFADSFLVRTRVEVSPGVRARDDAKAKGLSVIDISLCCKFNSQCDGATWFVICGGGHDARIVPLKSEAIADIDHPKLSLFDCLVEYLQGLIERMQRLVSGTPIDNIEAYELDCIEVCADRQVPLRNNSDDRIGRAVHNRLSPDLAECSATVPHDHRLSVAESGKETVRLERHASEVSEIKHRYPFEQKAKKYRGALSPLIASLPQGPVSDALLHMLA